MEQTQQQPEAVKVTVVVHVCPTPGCGNYFGSSSTPVNLAEHFNEKGDLTHDQTFKPYDDENNRTFSRARCADCANSGRGEVMRVPKAVTITV